MPLPSGTFSHAQPGLLTVLFSGTYSGTGGGAPAWSYTAPSDIVIRCNVRNGGTVLATGLMSRQGANPLVLSLQYPGGGVSWNLEMASIVAQQVGGAGTVTASNLTISAQLTKR